MFRSLAILDRCFFRDVEDWAASRRADEELLCLTTGRREEWTHSVSLNEELEVMP